MPPKYIRKVIRIRGEDSPNVRYALSEIAQGKDPSGKILVPGVLPWHEYKKRLATWDSVRICIGISAEFYEGAEVLLFPPEWLNRAERLADQLDNSKVSRKALAIGVDPAEGGDKTCMAVVDRLGIINLVSESTPDTSVITGKVLALAMYYGVDPTCIVFDRGGGGKQHADTLRNQGYPVRTVAFGESISLPPRRGLNPVERRKENIEERYAYKNRRAEMYGELRTLLDPSSNPTGFAISAKYSELRRQLSPIPLTYDQEGRLELLPKSRRGADRVSRNLMGGQSTTNRLTLTDLIGHSPDEADALVLAIHAIMHKSSTVRAGVI